MRPRTATLSHLVARAAGVAHKPGSQMMAVGRGAQPIADGMAPRAHIADRPDDLPVALIGARSDDYAREQDCQVVGPPCLSVARCDHRSRPGGARHCADLLLVVRQRLQARWLQVLARQDAVLRNGWWRYAATCAAEPKGARLAVRVPRVRRAQVRARPEHCRRDQATTRHGRAACVVWRNRSCVAQSPLFAKIPTSLRQPINSWVTNG